MNGKFCKPVPKIVLGPAPEGHDVVRANPEAVIDWTGDEQSRLRRCWACAVRSTMSLWMVATWAELLALELRKLHPREQTPPRAWQQESGMPIEVA